MICLQAGSYSSSATFAYYRGNGWWSAYAQSRHPTRGYTTGEHFVTRFKARSDAEARAKWAPHTARRY